MPDDQIGLNREIAQNSQIARDGFATGSRENNMSVTACQCRNRLIAAVKNKGAVGIQGDRFKCCGQVSRAADIDRISGPDRQCVLTETVQGSGAQIERYSRFHDQIAIQADGGGQDFRTAPSEHDRGVIGRQAGNGLRRTIKNKYTLRIENQRLECRRRIVSPDFQTVDSERQRIRAARPREQVALEIEDQSILDRQIAGNTRRARKGLRSASAQDQVRI